MNLYAWKHDTYGVIYTSSATPSYGDPIYDNEGKVIITIGATIAGSITNCKVSSVSGNTLVITGDQVIIYNPTPV